MKIFILILLLTYSALSLAHIGRTDSSGGHNCSSKSQAKGLFIMLSMCFNKG